MLWRDLIQRYRAAMAAGLGLPGPGQSEGGRKPAGRPAGLPAIVAGASLALPATITLEPAKVHRLEIHKDWFGQSRVYAASWADLHWIWSKFARGAPYEDRPTTYNEPAGGFDSINGQPVTLDRAGSAEPPLLVKAADKQVIPAAGAVLARVRMRKRTASIFWRNRGSWLHWKSLITMETSSPIDMLPTPVAGPIALRPTARLRFRKSDRAVPTKALRKIEELAAKIGQIFPWSNWAITTFRGADPTWWDGKQALVKWIGQRNLQRIS